jgi:hypothetical protein
MKKVACVFASLFAIALSTIADPTTNSAEASASEANHETVAEARLSLSGSIYDPNCNEAVSGATITIDGKKYYSDLAGNFQVNELTKGKHTIAVDFVSYQSKTLQVDISESEVLDIELIQQ